MPSVNHKQLLVVIPLFFVFGVCAQKWDKAFTKLDASYELGDYAKAKKGITKVEKKVRKKLGANNPIYISTIVRKAKYNDGLGLLNEVEPVLQVLVGRTLTQSRIELIESWEREEKFKRQVYFEIKPNLILN